MEENGYLSETYFNVVIRDGSYLGWKAIFVGCGSMTFRHNELGDIKIKETGKNSSWMQDCWDQFKEYAENNQVAK